MTAYILSITCYTFIKGKKIFGTEILERIATHMYSHFICASLMVFWGNHAEDRMCQNSSIVYTFHSLVIVQKIAAIIHFDIGSILVCGESGSKR
jgi:hypothetical protein